MKKIALLSVFLSVHLFILANIQFIVWPEMILYPWLISKGFLLYKDIINPYFPGLTLFLLIYFKILGFSILNLKILTWGVILFNDFLIFFLTLKVFKNIKMAFISLLFYIFWQPFLEGNGLWFDLFLTPLPLLIWAMPSYSHFPAILALLIKQTAVVFFIPFFSFSSKIKFRFWLIIPTVFIVILYLILISTKGLGREFLFWTVEFPIRAGSFPGYLNLPNLKEVLVLILFLLPLSLVFFLKKSSKIFFLLLMTVTSSVFVYPRFSFFHLQPFIALYSILIGYIFYSIYFTRFKSDIFLFAFLIFFWTILLGNFYLKVWGKPVRFLEPEVLYASQYLKKNLNRETFWIYNAPQLLYFLTDKTPLKPWADFFPWYYEVHRTEDKILENLKAVMPSYVVYRPFLKGEKYQIGSFKPEKIDQFIFAHYQIEDKITDNIFLLKKK